MERVIGFGTDDLVLGKDRAAAKRLIPTRYFSDRRGRIYRVDTFFGPVRSRPARLRFVNLRMSV